ncbi:MAG: hypothetical protein ACI4LM_04570, partial [Anaerovoracaceae bacterium]
MSKCLMRKKLKAVLSLLLSLAIVFCMMPGMGMAAPRAYADGSEGTGYLSKLIVYSGNKPSENIIKDDQKEYTVEVPASVSSIALMAELSEGAPKDSEISVGYKLPNGQPVSLKLTAGKKKTITGLIGEGGKGNTCDITVGTSGGSQTYKLYITRPLSIEDISICKADGKTALTFIGENYYVPEAESAENIKVKANAYGASMTINGNAASDGKAVSLTPSFDADGRFVVDIKAEKDGKQLEKKINVYKLTADTGITDVCGNNKDASWTLKNGVLTISGKGEIK